MTTQEGIKQIKNNMTEIDDWKKIQDGLSNGVIFSLFGRHHNLFIWIGIYYSNAGFPDGYYAFWYVRWVWHPYYFLPFYYEVR